jgi:hypothetical protein
MRGRESELERRIAEEELRSASTLKVSRVPIQPATAGEGPGELEDGAENEPFTIRGVPGSLNPITDTCHTEASPTQRYAPVLRIHAAPNPFSDDDLDREEYVDWTREPF